MFEVLPAWCGRQTDGGRQAGKQNRQADRPTERPTGPVVHKACQQEAGPGDPVHDQLVQNQGTSEADQLLGPGKSSNSGGSSGRSTATVTTIIAAVAAAEQRYSHCPATAATAATAQHEPQQQKRRSAIHDVVVLLQTGRPATSSVHLASFFYLCVSAKQQQQQQVIGFRSHRDDELVERESHYDSHLSPRVLFTQNSQLPVCMQNVVNFLTQRAPNDLTQKARRRPREERKEYDSEHNKAR